MPVEDLLTREITIVRRSASGEDDGYGNELFDSEETEVLGELQRVKQQAGDEPGAAGEFSDTEWKLILSMEDGAGLKTSDAVRVDGKTYELVGDSWEVWNPRLAEFDHVEATLKVAE